ncbi:hypothetical protein [Streptomyces sparsogenes]|uniref:hypothetical protein n=1 Tax=Streptomyces sparsogenes TaxID=67365 RepID=UPI003F4CBE0D
MAGPAVAGVLVGLVVSAGLVGPAAPAAVVVSAPVGPAFRRAPVVSAALVGLAAVVASGVPAAPAVMVVSDPVGPAFRRAPVVSPAPAVLVAPAAPVGRRGGVARGPLPVAHGRRPGRGR